MLIAGPIGFVIFMMLVFAFPRQFLWLIGWVIGGCVVVTYYPVHYDFPLKVWTGCWIVIGAFIGSGLDEYNQWKAKKQAEAEREAQIDVIAAGMERAAVRMKHYNGAPAGRASLANVYPERN
jgi:hypothetical protein